jgi:hypothetical protein
MQSRRPQSTTTDTFVIPITPRYRKVPRPILGCQRGEIDNSERAPKLGSIVRVNQFHVQAQLIIWPSHFPDRNNADKQVFSQRTRINVCRPVVLNSVYAKTRILRMREMLSITVSTILLLRRSISWLAGWVAKGSTATERSLRVGFRVAWLDSCAK